MTTTTSHDHIDSLGSELAFRWTLIALNTTCRPEAGLGLGPDQVDRKNGLVELSPPDRPQQPTKLRPVLRLTDCLRGWVEHWEPRRQDIKGEDEHALLLRTASWKPRLRHVHFRPISLQVPVPFGIPFCCRSKNPINIRW